MKLLFTGASCEPVDRVISYASRNSCYLRGACVSTCVYVQVIFSTFIFLLVTETDIISHAVFLFLHLALEHRLLPANMAWLCSFSFKYNFSASGDFLPQ